MQWYGVSALKQIMLSYLPIEAAEIYITSPNVLHLLVQ